MEFMSGSPSADLLPGMRPPLARDFNPYASNGGTILALSGEDFSLVASDTRLSEGFRIHTRDQPKAYRLTDNVILGLDSCVIHSFTSNCLICINICVFMGLWTCPNVGSR